MIREIVQIFCEQESEVFVSSATSNDHRSWFAPRSLLNVAEKQPLSNSSLESRIACGCTMWSLKINIWVSQGQQVKVDVTERMRWLQRDTEHINCNMENSTSVNEFPKCLLRNISATVHSWEILPLLQFGSNSSWSNQKLQWRPIKIMEPQV